MTGEVPMNERRLSTALAAALFLIISAPAWAQEAPPEAGPIAEPASEASVATTMSASERMLVQVRIGGAGPYPFIVDTAAESSVISRELARDLGLTADGRATLLSMTSSRDISMVRMPGV